MEHNDKSGEQQTEQQVQQVDQTKDSMRTGSVTVPTLSFPEDGDGSGFTTYTNIRRTESTPNNTGTTNKVPFDIEYGTDENEVKDTPKAPFDIEYGTDDDVNTQRSYAKENPTQAPLVLKTGKTPFDIEYGTDEDRVALQKKTREKNEKNNEGFDPNFKLPENEKKFFAYEDLVKRNMELEKQIQALAESNKFLAEMEQRYSELQRRYDIVIALLAQNGQVPTAPYNQDPALAAALDPNRQRPLDPLEDVRNRTIAEQNKKAEEFVKQVQEEDRLHNPLNPANVPPAIPPVVPTTEATTNNNASVNPELQNTSAKDAAEKAEKEAKERSLKKATILGAVVGGATIIAAGTGVAIPATIVCAVGGLASRGLEWAGGKRITILNQRITTAEANGDTTTSEKLKKRVEKWNKVRNGCKYVTRFFGGAAIGIGIGSFISGVALGGHGVVWNRPEPIIPTPSNPTGGGAEVGPGPETGGAGGGSDGPIETPFDSGLVQDGRVVLPGDPSNGNLATGPDSLLNGGATNTNNFPGGASGRGWWELNNQLNQAHIKVSDLQAAGGDLHRMGYALQVDPTRTLPDLLHQFGGESVLTGAPVQ